MNIVTQLNLLQLIEVKQNFEKLLNQKLLEFVCYFQNHMWDGFSDEDDPRFISQEDFEAIDALSDKILHMVLHIGCPSSVPGMIESICNRKIKHWVAYDSYCGGDSFIYHKGIQIKSKGVHCRVMKDRDCHNDKNIISGHFRWNNRGYILSRRASELLREYYGLLNLNL
jgi:hypothetical protein